MNSNQLNKTELEEIKHQALEKLGICRKTYDIIGTQIFSILGLYARVIYYPLGEGAPWGFTRISGSDNNPDPGKPFVVINTSIAVPCQVFAAAHELYHIWYEQKPDILPSNLLEEEDKQKNGRRANRFAAEFLMNETMLHQEIELYGMKNISTKEVLQLSDLFTVPYRAMVKRLAETGRINDDEKTRFLLESEKSIEISRKKYAFSAGDADRRIAVDNLVELSVKAYNAKLVTFEKLEYLLGICGLKTEDLGIRKVDEAAFPDERELDEIMGE